MVLVGVGMKNEAPAINLIKNKKQNSLDKLLDWALTFGRVVIILTEAIALSAFLYRFSLDRDLIDLKEKINQKAKILELSEANENRYRNLQERLALIAKLDNTSTESNKVLTDIVALAPADIIFNNLSYSSENMRIDTNIQSVPSFSYFINALRNYPQVNFVSIDKIENKTSNATISVGISITFKKDQKVAAKTK